MPGISDWLCLSLLSSIPLVGNQLLVLFFSIDVILACPESGFWFIYQKDNYDSPEQVGAGVAQERGTDVERREALGGRAPVHSAGAKP